MAVALAALDARLHLASTNGTRTVSLLEFHCLPGERPDLETVLAPGEMIAAVEIPAPVARARSTYRKVRDRASYAFALVSVAAELALEGDRIADVRVAFGGVAARPWRAFKAEAALRGEVASAEAFARAADAELADAAPLEGNAFKVALAKRTMAAVLTELSGDRA
jgi:xanthine dehydrogenase YagS FAD-binding subunit